MLTFGATFDRQSGPDVVKSHKITFSVDETQTNEDYKKVSFSTKGQPYLMVLFELNEFEKNSSFTNEESELEIKRRLQQKLHAKISTLAKSSGKEAKSIKDSLKEKLIEKKYMKRSTKELDAKGYAAGIYILEQYD